MRSPIVLTILETILVLGDVRETSATPGQQKCSFRDPTHPVSAAAHSSLLQPAEL